MSAKVVLKFTKGSRAGSEFVYTEKELILLGRDENDCNIVFSEPTISRAHCFLEIVPPAVRVHDMGSLNGTFLNGTLIGKRSASMSVAEGRNLLHNELNVKAGDRLRLGGDCEFMVNIVIPLLCSECSCEIDGPKYANSLNKPICAACYEKENERVKAEQEALKKLEQKRLKAKKEAKELAEKAKAEKDALAQKKVEDERKEAERIAASLEKEKELIRKVKVDNNPQARKRKCEVCGAALEDELGGPNICINCLLNPIKILEFLLNQADQGEESAREIAGYRNIKTLGHGGMGEVWLVTELATGKEMALKLMLPRASANEEAKAMFVREAYTLGQLKHKNVVEQFKSGRSGDIYFILMEYCKEGSVDKLMEKNRGKLKIDLATHIILEVLDGLHYLHTKPADALTIKGEEIRTKGGIVHRDFKPANIFLNGDTAKVADFGLAKAFDAAGLSGFTHTGAKCGTYKFMPRQQVLNFKNAQPEVDVWAAAATYYFMLTGCFARDYTDNKDLVEQVLHNPPVPIRNRDSGIPKRLAEVIDEALIERPSIRIKTAAELRQAIKAAL
jgi:serine/threonine-protein kinase